MLVEEEAAYRALPATCSMPLGALPDPLEKAQDLVQTLGVADLVDQGGMEAADLASEGAVEKEELEESRRVVVAAVRETVAVSGVALPWPAEGKRVDLAGTEARS